MKKSKPMSRFVHNCIVIAFKCVLTINVSQEFKMATVLMRPGDFSVNAL